MKMMKRYFYLVLILLGIFSIQSCQKKQKEEVKPVKVTIIRSVSADAFTELENGIREQLSGKNIEINSYSAESDPSKFETVVKSALLGKPDYLVICGALLANIAYSPQYRESLPVVISTAVDEPDGVEILVREGINPPRKSPLAIVAGMPEESAYDGLARNMKLIRPDMKKAGILYSEGDISAKITAEKTIQSLEKEGITTEKGLLTSPDDVMKVLKALIVKKVEAIILPHDKFAMLSSNAIAKECHSLGIPTFSLDDMSVKKGGLAFSCAIEYHDLGVLTGQTVLEIIEGKKAEEIPVRRIAKPNFYINKKAVFDDMKLTLPQELTQNAIIQ